MKKLINKLRKNPDIFYSIYKIYLPIKNIKNRDIYNKYYDIESENLLKTKGKKILFIGVPIHNNLGDQAQYYCIKKWLKNNYSDYSIVEFTDNIIYKKTILWTLWSESSCRRKRLNRKRRGRNNYSSNRSIKKSRH